MEQLKPDSNNNNQYNNQEIINSKLDTVSYSSESSMETFKMNGNNNNNHHHGHHSNKPVPIVEAISNAANLTTKAFANLFTQNRSSFLYNEDDKKKKKKKSSTSTKSSTESIKESTSKHSKNKSVDLSSIVTNTKDLEIAPPFTKLNDDTQSNNSANSNVNNYSDAEQDDNHSDTNENDDNNNLIKNDENSKLADTDPFEMNNEELLDDKQMDNLACKCDDHKGKEMINKVFNLSVDYLFELLFTHSEFNKKYWQARKFNNVKMSEWELNNGGSIRSRHLEYSLDLGTFGNSRNVEEQRILYKQTNQIITVETETNTSGVPYGDYFSVVCKFCITRFNATSSRLLVTNYINYKKTPNFVAKSFIERNSTSAMKECFSFLETSLSEVQQPISEPSQLKQTKLKHRRKSSSSADSETDLSENETPPKPDQFMKHKNIQPVTTSTQFRTNAQSTNQSAAPQAAYLIQTTTPQYQQINIPVKVPVNRFTIIKLEIDQETFFRYLIFMLIFVLLSNAILFIKLTYTESQLNYLIDSYQSNHINEYMTTCEKLVSNEELKLSIRKDIDNWRDTIASTMSSIKNIESTLQKWDTNLETVKINS